MLVLDNCEHVIGAAAALAEAVLRAGGTLHPRHQPRAAAGGRRAGLSRPAARRPGGRAEDAGDLLRYGAVRLFVERRARRSRILRRTDAVQR